METLLWTHPSGSQAGIADALEYLNKVTRSPISKPRFFAMGSAGYFAVHVWTSCSEFWAYDQACTFNAAAA